MPNPSTLLDFHSIILCNFSKKIISVVIALHLGSLLPSIICEDQYAFLKDWSITDNILLALELTQSINRKTPGGNLTLKLDLQKDFEWVSWVSSSRWLSVGLVRTSAFLLRIVCKLMFSRSLLMPTQWCFFFFFPLEVSSRRSSLPHSFYSNCWCSL